MWVVLTNGKGCGLRRRRPRQERLKREGKSVNLSSATVPRLREARPGGACSRMRGKCVNRAHRPSAARQKCPHHVPGFRGSDGAAFKSRSVSRDSPAKVRRQGPWCQRSAVAQPVHTAAPGTPEGRVEQPSVEAVFADEPATPAGALKRCAMARTTCRAGMLMHDAVIRQAHAP